LKISDKDVGIIDIVEVFKTVDSGKVEEIWSLLEFVSKSFNGKKRRLI
jgi:hypothetical protein